MEYAFSGVIKCNINYTFIYCVMVYAIYYRLMAQSNTLFITQ